MWHRTEDERKATVEAEKGPTTEQEQRRVRPPVTRAAFFRYPCAPIIAPQHLRCVAILAKVYANHKFA
jgi:hypothetical protein